MNFYLFFGGCKIRIIFVINQRGSIILLGILNTADRPPIHAKSGFA